MSFENRLHYLINIYFKTVNWGISKKKKKKKKKQFVLMLAICTLALANFTSQIKAIMYQQS